MVPGWTFNEYRHIANASTLNATYWRHYKYYLMDKKQHLEELYQLLRDTEKEYYFDNIYDLLQSEIQNEQERDISKNPYLHNLNITKDKQAESYKRALMTNPKGNHYELFSDFIRHFKNDVHDEIMRLTYLNK